MKIIRPPASNKRNFDPAKDWTIGPLIGFDTETTNPDPDTARIVSAAIVYDDPRTEVHKATEWLINPGCEIELGATAVHGISTEHATAKGMPRETGIREITSYLAYGAAMHIPLVMVNAPFDLTILYNELTELDMRDEFPELPFIIDTLACDRWLDPYRPGRRSLTATAASYEIAIKGAHTATGDVECSIRLVRAIGRKYPAFAHADLAALQIDQRKAYANWAESFETFRRMEDETFTVSRAWPYRERAH